MDAALIFWAFCHLQLAWDTFWALTLKYIRYISCIWGTRVDTWRNNKEVLQFRLSCYGGRVDVKWIFWISLYSMIKKTIWGFHISFGADPPAELMWAEGRADVSPRRARVAAATLALAQPRLPKLLQSCEILQCVYISAKHQILNWRKMRRGKSTQGGKKQAFHEEK